MQYSMEESKIKVVAGKPYPALHFATLRGGGLNKLLPQVIFQLSLETFGGPGAGGEVDVIV